MRCLVIVSWLVLAGLARADESALAGATLDNFHQSAASADSVAYFAAMTDDVVFLGTDGSERWQGQEFRYFVTTHFAPGMAEVAKFKATFKEFPQRQKPGSFVP